MPDQYNNSFISRAKCRNPVLRVSLQMKSVSKTGQNNTPNNSARPSLPLSLETTIDKNAGKFLKMEERKKVLYLDGPESRRKTLRRACALLCCSLVKWTMEVSRKAALYVFHPSARPVLALTNTKNRLRNLIVRTPKNINLPATSLLVLILLARSGARTKGLLVVRERSGFKKTVSFSPATNRSSKQAKELDTFKYKGTLTRERLRSQHLSAPTTG